ncbi:hypothetical protein Q8A73_017983 [Channa argus]|nr:hypothetical protein Q8A73_017983 [Channa argus]
MRQVVHSEEEATLDKVTHLHSSANYSQEPVRRTNEVLREMGRLKSEMKMLLMPEDSLRTTSPPPDHMQSHQNQTQQTKSQRSKSQQHYAHPSKKVQSHQSHSHQSQSHSQQSQSQLIKSQQHYSHQNQPLSQNVKSNQSPFQQFQSHQNHSQQSQPQSQIHSYQTVFQDKQNPTHQTPSHSQQSHPNPSQPNHFQSQQFQCQSWPIQSHQSLFPEIQSQQNHTQQTQSQQFQSVLVQKRPAVSSMLEEAGQVLRQVQRQKRVLEENLEALLRAKTGEVLHCQLEALAANRDWTEEVRVKKTVDAWINTLTKDIQDEMSSEDAVHHRAADTAVTSQQGACRGSAHPAKKRPMSMLRGIGSKTAAGRGSRAQTPGHRSVQGVDPDRATGVLTDREQVEGESYLTRLYGRAPYDGLRRTLKKSPYLRFSSPALALGRKSRPRLVESVRGVKVKSCKTQTCLAPPLNVSPVQHHHHTFSSTRMSSADIQSVPVAIPLGRPKIESSSRCCLSKHQQEVTSPPTAPPTVSVVALDDKAPEQQKVEQQDAGEAHPPSHTIDIMERRSGVEEEDTVFPGTDLLFVADIIQEEVSAVGEEAVELDGGSSPPPVMYQGPVFPPQALPALPEQNQAPILVLDQQKGALETQLVEWVEQQLMSRMISQMYQPPPPDPAQKISTDQSESEERSVTSDIVEAAGGGGVQLFVDSNIEVDSALIRQLVNEVLTETVTLMLGQRKALNTGPEPGPGPEAAQKDKLVPLVPTPVPTPSASPTPACRDATPLTTPPPSEPVSLFIEESQPITVPDPVATPTPSPEPTPSPGIPPVLHQASLSAAWEDAELPLEEERPEENLDTHKPPLLMSVAEEEPPHSSPHPPPSPSPPPPVLEPAPLSPTSSSEDSSSSNSSSNSSSSSTAVTAGTDAALKHISEGELLISVNQQAALTEEGAMCSFSSSLQELQDMDFDPPSEGQVKGHDHLLTKREQGHFNRGERLQPEGSWGREDEEEMSVGEVRDNRTTNSSKSMMAQQDHSSSPGQISLCADMSEVSFEGTNQGSVTMDNLMMEALDTLSSDLQIDLSLSLPPPHLENTHTAAQVVPILLQQNNPQADAQQKQQQGGGTRGMDVHLPSIRPEEEELMEESLSEAATTDSSTDDRGRVLLGCVPLGRCQSVWLELREEREQDGGRPGVLLLFVSSTHHRGHRRVGSYLEVYQSGAWTHPPDPDAAESLTEDMLLSTASRRDRAADLDAAERLRSIRERLDATMSGLEELEFLRQRQEVLVRAALELREVEGEVEEAAERRREVPISSEEKLLEENILLLRKQLNCLRRRDAGLISQLQELDRQICDLRLDTDMSRDQPETDSRPSSGFYELSDGASGSLSNSSNSVFSECFCSMAEADGRLLSTDELASCLECDGLVGGLCDDSASSGTVRRSLSVPHPPTQDPSVACCDPQLKYHCDLVARNSSDVYRYPSPLHAVAVQSPVFLHKYGHGGQGRDEGRLKSTEAGIEVETSPLPTSMSAPLVCQSSPWPALSSSSQTLSHKRLDSYIYSLLQRKALPIRTSRPRTSISTDPSKSILRQVSLCVRQVSAPSSGAGLGILRGSELKASWPNGGVSPEDVASSSSPQRQWSMESKIEGQETQKGFSGCSADMMQAGFIIHNSDLVQNPNSSSPSNGIQKGCSVANKDFHTRTNSLQKKNSKGLLPLSAGSTATLPNDFRELSRVNTTTKETKQPCYPQDQDLGLKSSKSVKTATPKNSPKTLQTCQTEKNDRLVPEMASIGSSSQSHEGGGEGGSSMVNAKYLSTQQQNINLHKGGSKSVKVKMIRAFEHNDSSSERKGDKTQHRSSSRKSQLVEDGSSTHSKVSKRLGGGAPRVSSRYKRISASIPEGRVLDKCNTSTLSSLRSGTSKHHHRNHHHCSGHHHHHGHYLNPHHHGRDQVVVIAKPKHKRSDYRRLRAIMEVPYDEALRRAQRRQRNLALTSSAHKVYRPSSGQLSGPYSYVAGSDSEYSAECASLFHSTIVDTSEDEKSNYTTNCFGDSESSEEDSVEGSTTTSDTEESGGGGTDGMGRGWDQLGASRGGVVGQEMTPSQAKAFVKIKASHNLKKKILRFRSGSLKLMTTV